MKTGDRLKRYFPWMSGIQECVVVEKRILAGGDYALDSFGRVFKRVGTEFISKRDKDRKYWVVEICRQA